MASAKQFLGKSTASNKKVAAVIKTGTKLKILEVSVKETPKTKDPCLAIRVKGCPHWIRIPTMQVETLSAKWGDETDDWIGKEVTLDYQMQDVLGTSQHVFAFRPH